MRWSRFFIPTLKEVPAGTEAVSHQLLLRAGLVNMLTSGVYSYLPLGYRVLRKVEEIITQEMDAIGAQKLFLPCLQPIELWKKTGRDKVMADVMIRFEDKKGKSMCLGPTHEEVITELVKNYVQSYKQLPMTLYQIQTKFRDELRTRFGIVRACEFIMKDAYSFDRNAEGLDKNYQLMYQAYQKIFARCGVDTAIIEADSGAMGGDVSHEFMVPASIGEDHILICSGCEYRGAVTPQQDEGASCPRCKKGKLKKQVAIEIGHIFKLGTKYSEAQGALFLDENGKQHPIIMGCYGIGVSRLIATIIEKNHDQNGIIWPLEVAPFAVEIIPVQNNEPAVAELAEKYYRELSDAGLDVLLDDRDESAGKRFKDADLIGMPWQIVIGKRTLAENKVEIKKRAGGETMSVDAAQAKTKILELLK
jgi:prolyl-tRNA synthetase